MNLTRARSLLLSDPGLFCRKSAARLIRRIPLFPRRVVRSIRGVRFECDLDLDARVADMLLSAYEPDEIAILERFLRPGDVFVDVGANIGYLTAIGASLVGPGGSVHSFEPVPEYARRLEALRDANPRYTIHVNPIALGEQEGAAEIAQAADGNIGWNTMVRGLLPEDGVRRRHDVSIQRLDRYLADRQITGVSLIKIDAEGYELPILRGASGFLEAARPLPAILCEVAPRAYPFLGGHVTDLLDLVHRYGYSALDVERGCRPIGADELTSTTNVLFLPAESVGGAPLGGALPAWRGARDRHTVSKDVGAADRGTLDEEAKR